MDETYLYPWTAKEAQRQGELALWRASHRANIACARAIEAAIRAHFDGAHLAGDCLRVPLQRFGYGRTAWVLANTIRQAGWDERISRASREWAQGVPVPQDERHDGDFVVAHHPTVLDGAVAQYREAYQALGLFEAAQCEPEPSSGLDYEGKVLVLSPRVLREDCLAPQGQLWYARGGFGCSPHARGRAIHCTCLGDGETAYWERADFLGILKEEHLPEWAAARLAELRGQEGPEARQEEAPPQAGPGMEMDR